MINKQSIKEVESRTLTQEQLAKVIGTRRVITATPSNNVVRQAKCRFCGKGFSQHFGSTNSQTLLQRQDGNEDTANTTPIEEEALVQPLKGCYHNQPWTLQCAGPGPCMA
eukprot:1516184-Amphidinium_carterae.1